MSAILFTRETEPQFVSRLKAIQQDAKPLWGSLTPTRLMRHLRRSIEISLNEVEVKDKSNWFSRHVVKYLLFNLFTTWPRGLKAPEVFFPEDSGDFEKEREALLRILERFLVLAEDEPQRLGVSPFIGPQPMKYWRRIHGVHMTHHLRQFGV